MRKRKEFSDPLLAFDNEDETVDDARLRLARKLVDSIEVSQVFFCTA